MHTIPLRSKSKGPPGAQTALSEAIRVKDAESEVSGENLPHRELGEGHAARVPRPQPPRQPDHEEDPVGDEAADCQALGALTLS